VAHAKPRSPSSGEASRDGPGLPHLTTLQTADGPVRLFRRGPYGWAAADFRYPWHKGRPTLHDPTCRCWPAPCGVPSHKTQDVEVASKWVLDAYLPLFRDETQRQQRHLGPRPQRLGDAAEAYLRYRRYGGAAAPGAPESRVALNTWQADTVALNHLLRFAREDGPSRRRGLDLRTHQLTAELLARLFDQLLAEEYKVNTVRNYQSSLSAFLRWLGHGRENGAAACQLPKRSRRQETHVHTWSDEEVERIRAAAVACDGRYDDFRHHLRAVDWALASGGRRFELFASEYRFFRPDQDEYRFTFQIYATGGRLVQLKGHNARTSLLLKPGQWSERVDPNGTGYLLPGRDGRLMRPQTIVEIGQRILDAAGLHAPGIGWHSFRHTYSRDFLLYGGDLGDLQESLGHESIQTTQSFYKHWTSDQAAQAARRKMLRFLDGSSPVRLVG
jgi:integrase